MDSGREALLEKAREFGSLAHNMTFQDFLDKSITYRSLAQLLGIHKEWWEEFWRFYNSSCQKAERKNLQRVTLCGKAKDLSFIMTFLSSWFGKGTKIKDISKKEFSFAYHLAIRG